MIQDDVLKSKPLVEAYFELRWRLQPVDDGGNVDPNYKVLFGRLFDKLKDKFQKYEPLAAARIPDEMAGHMVQHRFRARPDDWPILQVGPGVFTINETEKYNWKDFKSLVLESVSTLFAIYPNPSELNIQGISLKYIDAIDFDYKNENLLHFLSKYLKINITLSDKLFDGTKVRHSPVAFTWETAFQCESPKGQIVLFLGLGQRKKNGESSPALIWHTTLRTAGNDLPNIPDDLENWLEHAHSIIHTWFFKLIEGDLERRFRGE